MKKTGKKTGILIQGLFTLIILAEVYIRWYFKAIDSSADLGIYNFALGNRDALSATGFPFKAMAIAVLVLAFIIAAGIIVKKQKIASAFLVVISVISGVAVASGIYSKYTDERDIAGVRELLCQEKYIIHAGGDVTGKSGESHRKTNSQDALENCYQEGNRVSEFDFRVTSDGYLVCAHDKKGDPIEWCEGSGLYETPTLEEFNNAGIYGELSTLTLTELAEFMREHDDFYVVTDCKDNNYEECKLIQKECSDILDRFIVQIYSYNQYEKITSLGFKNIIFTLYRIKDEDMDFGKLKQFTKEMDLVGYTFSTARADDSVFLESIKENNIPMFVHTVNDMDEMKKYLVDCGVDGIYTDVSKQELHYYE